MTHADRTKSCCRVCAGPLPPTAVRDPVCERPECRRAYFLEWHAKIQAPIEREQRRRELLERAGVEETIRAILGSGEPATGTAVVPAWSPQLVRSSIRRRRAFGRKLRSMLTECEGRSFEPDGDAPEPDPPALKSIVERICALCSGWCCRSGGNHAYLTLESLNRYRRHHPERSIDDVLDDFVSRLPERVHRNSCIYHGPDGCGLPREMRSETCNRHYCGGMHRFRAEAVSAQPVLIVAAMGGTVLWAASICADQTRRIALPTVAKGGPVCD